MTVMSRKVNATYTADQVKAAFKVFEANAPSGMVRADALIRYDIISFIIHDLLLTLLFSFILNYYFCSSVFMYIHPCVICTDHYVHTERKSYLSSRHKTSWPS